MKKTLAMILALVMVSALCGMLFVSAEDVNLAAGKGWSGETEIGTNYVGDLTDGKIETAGAYDTTLWYGADNRKEAEGENNGAFSMIVDLGGAHDVGSARIHVWPAGASGIVVPASIDFYASADGENFEKIGSVSEFDGNGPQWVSVSLEEAVEATHIRFDMVGQVEGDTGVFWFASELEVYGAGEAGDAPSEDEPSEDEPVDESKTYEETLVKGEDGNYTCEVPYGYTWTVNYVDGKIVGEDVTICTTDEAYKACNPNWAITILAEKQEDGTYVAVQDAVATPGNADAVTVGANQIAIVVHSAASNPDPDKDGKTYANWKGKVVAMAVKTGDVFQINEDKTSVYAVIPGESLDAPSEAPSQAPESSNPPKTGDAGILVFAVLGVVAIAGAAVTIKARG